MWLGIIHLLNGPIGVSMLRFNDILYRPLQPKNKNRSNTKREITHSVIVLELDTHSMVLILVSRYIEKRF